ncbi:amidase [Pisciglobus halotolerans]|uniref:Amidase n=1 Tax=Pisciglobus halotolerans TaxID=745365 RepID=A0A1I3CXR9_9LACT|nr:amidase [Pisciglobus halotolerans]SFH79282.1 amidase [Pisciglobus halotolerans]
MYPFDRTKDGLYYVEQVQKKLVSPKELVEKAFCKIEKENPILNAVTHTRKEKALQEAKKQDFSGKVYGGIPILVKGLGQDLAGEPSTSGAKLLKNNRAKQTSHFAAMLQKAGFIVIGQTNTPEFGFKNITEPELYGPARNPWNTNHSPGGSSGGAAAAVASGMSPVAGASDGGGSIRIPASFTGLVGLKPTRGRTPIGPGVGRNWQGASISFALTKSIRDTAAMLDALQVVQPAAAFQTPLFESGYINLLKEKSAKKFRVAFSLASPVGSAVSEEAKQAVLDTVKWLEANGHQVTEAAPDIDGIHLMKSYYLMNSGETTAMLEGIEQSLQRKLTIEDMELVTWVLFQAGKSISAASYSQSLNTWDQAAETMATFNETYDLYLTPATAETAPKVGTQWQSAATLERMRQIDSFSSAEQQQIVWEMFEKSLPITPFGMQANLTGQPSISLPTYLAANGLPLGIQFTAPKGKEDWLLAIGQEMEQDGQFI